MKKKDVLQIQTQTVPDMNTRAEQPVPLVEPQLYERHKLLACKFCGKKMHDGGKAVVLRSTKWGTAYVRSKCCGKNWSVKMREL